MTIDRRRFLNVAAGIGAGLVAAPAIITRPARAAAKIGDNGLHTQTWFHESFLDLGEDHAEAAAEGKGLVVFFEQRGCPYCREMHEVNLERQDISDYIKEHFYAVQLDLWGSREVTDFDGEAMEERALARKWNVMFTPTLSFFAKDADIAGKSGRMAETARMPGYFKPFHFHTMFSYVAEDHWKDTHFQKYLGERFEELRAAGKDPDLW